MTEKELREIKRRFRPERSNIPRIVGCFVNEAGQIVSHISQSLSLGEDLVTEKLLGVMKKTLSGTLGINLTDVSYSTRQVTESPEHKLLMKLCESRLGDEEALESFYAAVIPTVKIESNYAILLASDVYDVPTYGKDGDSFESSEVFSYIVAAICPLKNLPEALTFRESDSLFHAFSPTSVLSVPVLGFMFPTFDDRRTNIYGALLYTRSLKESYPDFLTSVLASEPKMPPKAQTETFGECLSTALGEECTLDVVRTVQSELAEMLIAHKESGDPEPLTFTADTAKQLLSSAGVGDEGLDAVADAFTESFGKNAVLCPRNMLPMKKFDVTTPEVTVKIDPEHKDLVTTEVINGQKYLMIRITGETRVNGVSINIDD